MKKKKKMRNQLKTQNIKKKKREDQKTKKQIKKYIKGKR